MKSPLKTGMVWLGLTASLLGDQSSEMLSGLRERQYFDYAFLYLDQLATRTDLPDEVRQALPYERAVTLLESARATRSPEQQLKQLDQATGFLTQFAKENPNHPRAGDANMQRAEILLQKARVEILQSRLPANQKSRVEFQKKARDWIKQARDVFETAQKQYDETLKKFGTFIDKQEFPEKFAAREKVLVQLVMALNNVCLCRYEEAQTHDPGSAEFKRLSTQAAQEFEQVSQRYRDYAGGLYARLYEARCFDEQGDAQQAMGIYNELLEHASDNASLRSLQNKTLQFKLEALNRKQPPDAQVVVDLAADWLKANAHDTRTATGLAIQWQQAAGYEALGDQRDANKPDKDRNWRSARTLAQTISRFPGEYRDVSLAMVQRLDERLGGRDRKPIDFNGAFSLAEQHFGTVRDLRNELETARKQEQPAEDIRKLEQDLQTEMHAAAELFQAALNFAGSKDNPGNVCKARLWLAYVHFWARRNYEAAILGEYVAKTASKEDSAIAVDGQYLALAAYLQAYNETKNPEWKGADLDSVIAACNLITTRWPESDRANDARIMAGRVYSQAKKPTEAAAWFSQVPESDARYAEAQLEAGQAYWSGYITANRLPIEQRPSADQLHQWQSAAQQHLRTGMARLATAVAEEGEAPTELIRAKTSLAEILNSQGEYAQVITVLTEDPYSVTKAVIVPDEADRPPLGVHSRAFASAVYKILLRAYIGGGQLDDAQQAMKMLEQIAAGGTAGGDITELYVGLGRMLKDDLDRLQSEGETQRFQSVRTAFETFLNNIYQRQQGHSIGTLSWIGETYAALGEADSQDTAAAASYYEKAASAFQDIIRQAETNAGFATPEQLLAVKVRLAYCLRMKQDFAAAEKLLTELLQDRQDDLKLQMETARLYQAWGAKAGEGKKYLWAIGGRPENKTMGFAPLSKRILAAVQSGQRPDLFDTYLETRYQSAVSRYQFALTKKDAKEKRQELSSTKLEIVALARVTKEISEERRAQFNELYRQVLAAAKEPVVDLDWVSDIAADAPAETAQDVPKSPKQAAGKKKPAEPKTQAADPAMTYGLLGGAVVLGLGIAALMFWCGKRSRQPILKSQKPIEKMNFDFQVPESKPSPMFPLAMGTPSESGKASSPRKASVATPPAATAKPQPSRKPKPPPAS